ncbi:MAG: 4-alpha-glucanotransferase [delta proteobacterium ML8_F1]|nr:MAG: 4-alpha-glucanotransferase [delta proteobacterium ML8_F1]
MNNRSSGILLHITSLPGPYGIGTLGRPAYDFVDFLHESGQTYWQILPLGITSYGDSPYQSPSAFAGNHYLIDLDLLVASGYLKKEDLAHLPEASIDDPVDFHDIFITRIPLLKIARRNRPEELEPAIAAFRQTHRQWLEPFALFMAIKAHFNLVPWTEWPEAYKNREAEALENFARENREEIDFWVFVQYLFFKQWQDLKLYAGEKGIRFIGDLPIYVAEDSVDVWNNPELFLLNDQKQPTLVAGCPPDDFSATGQLWGNPLYDWHQMKARGYQWWIRRIAMAMTLYDKVRIDHFRGFEAYWEIPSGSPTAQTGQWTQGPGLELFKAIEEALGPVDIIAEDLGYLTPSFYDFKDKTHFPGMNVMQFCFDARDTSNALPHDFEVNSLVYTGTHDNATTKGWLQEDLTEEDFTLAKEYLALTEEEGYVEGIIRGALATVCTIAVIPMQDYLNLGNEARMNTPSTRDGNWRWRMSRNALTGDLARSIRHRTEVFRRLNHGI